MVARSARTALLQRTLAYTIGLVFIAGLLGMLAAYVLFGHLGGTPVDFNVLFSAAPPLQEVGSPSLDEIEDARNVVLAGGSIGLLLGLAAMTGIARRAP